MTDFVSRKSATAPIRCMWSDTYISRTHSTSPTSSHSMLRKLLMLVALVILMWVVYKYIYTVTTQSMSDELPPVSAMSSKPEIKQFVQISGDSPVMLPKAPVGTDSYATRTYVAKNLYSDSFRFSPSD
jgi:hypothetical protein